MKLLQFALRASSASASSKELTEDEVALLQAIRPLLTNPDCHFLAVLTALVQSILEGRTDCPISGVFGAGKTRAAAAMIAGLLVMDPTLKVMVVTKENAAAHAFAKHIESLQLPPSLEEKFGRLVGATELEKGPASQSKLDILPGSRNTVLRTKQVKSLVAEVASIKNARNHTALLLGGCRRLILPLMMRANSTETWTKPLPLQEFPVKDLLYGVVITNKRQGGYARVMKLARSGAS